MKPAKFKYLYPSTIEETLECAFGHGEDVRFLAGGQSLVPMMNFRVATPEVLVDLNGIRELQKILIDDTGNIHIGAMTRTRTLETDNSIGTANPLLAEATKHIAHVQIRNRGTIGGSLAHADPAAELPGIILACDAEIYLQSPTRSRSVAAKDFFQGVFVTDIAQKELLIKVVIPAWPVERFWAFLEVARREGDFALVGVASWFDVDKSGRISDARVVAIGVSDRPVRLKGAEAQLSDQLPNSETFERASKAANSGITPTHDIHASAEYRREVSEVLVRRTLNEAWKRG